MSPGRRENHWRRYVVEMSKSVAVKVFVRKQDADIKDPSYRRKSSRLAKALYNAIVQTKYYQYFQYIKAMHAKEKTRCN
jgi:hypothetical protein